FRELSRRAANLRQDDDDAPLGAAPRELARERKGRPQVVARYAGRQKDDVAMLGDLGRQIVGKAARVGDDEIGDAVLAAQLLQALERARVDLRLEAGAHSERAPFDAGQLIEIEVGEQGFTPTMNRADRQEAGERALADAP